MHWEPTTSTKTKKIKLSSTCYKLKKFFSTLPAVAELSKEHSSLLPCKTKPTPIKNSKTSKNLQITWRPSSLTPNQLWITSHPPK